MPNKPTQKRRFSLPQCRRRSSESEQSEQNTNEDSEMTNNDVEGVQDPPSLDPIDEDIPVNTNNFDKASTGQGHDFSSPSSSNTIPSPPQISVDPEAEAFMASGRFDKAIQAYTDSLRACIDDPTKRKSLLIGRSQAYYSLSLHLRSIPAAQSEKAAVYAPDPEHLAANSLRDAENALQMDVRHIVATHRARGDALFLLEKYKDAKQAYEMASKHAPACNICRDKIRQCEIALLDDNTAAANQTAPEDTYSMCNSKRTAFYNAVECTLCLKLLYEPVTTACGHTFCKPCFVRSADHSNKCPMCRTVLHIGRELPVTVLLKNVIEKAFPEEYHARKVEEESMILSLRESSEREQRPRLPLFVMGAMLPGEHMALNIFEPRYRLMIRRCMEGGRRFGMATVDSGHQLHPVACEVEITECEPLPDGRYYIEIVGRRRYRLIDPGEQDGYRTALAEFFKDGDVAVVSGQHAAGTAVHDGLVNAGAPSSMNTDTTTNNNNNNDTTTTTNNNNDDTTTTMNTSNGNNTNTNSRDDDGNELEIVLLEVETMVDTWVERMRALGQSRRAAADLLRRVGEKPNRDDKEKLSFWMANLICPLVECNALKLEMLFTTSTLTRIKLIRSILQQMQGAQTNGCAVM